MAKLLKPNQYLKRLKTSLNEFDFDKASALTERIDPSTFNSKQAKDALGMLRRKKQFPEMERAASMFSFTVDDPQLQRQWAQSLLDQNRIQQALPILNATLKRVSKNPKEKSEIRGLLGRAYKQRYIDEGSKQDLKNAILSYRSGWRAKTGDYRWHGINLAALLKRAENDNVKPGIKDKYSAIARSILKEISGIKKPGVWDYATAIEASIALDDEESALKWSKKYVKHKDADAFELGSTLRQLKEVWQLDQTDFGRKLLPALESAALRQEGGEFQATPGVVPDDQVFEAVFGSESSVQLEWVKTMYDRSRAVGRVLNKSTGKRYGTGFLLKGSDLCQKWGDHPVFVTNAHVVSDDPADAANLQPKQASAEFTQVDGRPSAKFGEQLFTSRKTELDVGIYKMKPPAGVSMLESPFDRPEMPKKEGKASPRIYVVGHPQAGELAVTLYDNRLVGYQDPYAHYKSPTEKGNSGSPVFSFEWTLFALHHSARGALMANEGVLLDSIREAILRSPACN